MKSTTKAILATFAIASALTAQKHLTSDKEPQDCEPRPNGISINIRSTSCSSHDNKQIIANDLQRRVNAKQIEQNRTMQNAGIFINTESSLRTTTINGLCIAHPPYCDLSTTTSSDEDLVKIFYAQYTYLKQVSEKYNDTNNNNQKDVGEFTINDFADKNVYPSTYHKSLNAKLLNDIGELLETGRIYHQGLPEQDIETIKEAYLEVIKTPEHFGLRKTTTKSEQSSLLKKWHATYAAYLGDGDYLPLYSNATPHMFKHDEIPNLTVQCPTQPTHTEEDFSEYGPKEDLIKYCNGTHPTLN